MAQSTPPQAEKVNPRTGIPDAHKLERARQA